MTILIVDDNLSKCRKIENALIDAGNEFITVHGINVAKKILKENKNIDGIILDMQCLDSMMLIFSENFYPQ